MGLPSGTAIPIACVILAVLHLFDAEAKVSKWVIGAATVASFNLPAGVAWGITAMLTQLAVSVFVLLRVKAGYGPLSSNGKRG